MEASGVMAAASRHGIDWIIVKGICDWAFDKHDSDQKLAGENAATFGVKLIELLMDAELLRA